MTPTQLTYEIYLPEQEKLREALCTLGNGYFATRGAAPEASAGELHYPGTYVAGLYDRLETQIAGRTVENEDLVNVPNWLPVTFRIDGGPWFLVDDVEVLEFRQELDLQRGVLGRLVRFRDAEGRTTLLNQRRFVDMEDPHLAGIETTITPEDWAGKLEVRSALDGTVVNDGVARYRDLAKDHLVPLSTAVHDEEIVALEAETRQSRVRIAMAARTRLLLDGEPAKARRRTSEETGWVGQDLEIHAEAGRAVTVEKVVALHTSKDFAIISPAHAAVTRIRRAAGFDELLERHVLTWDHLWHRCAIEIDGDEGTALVLSLHIFHLLQTVSPNTIDLDVGVPARGWHGEAYRGHIFWDELFIFPFLNLRLPELTRELLLYRYRRLPEARWAARQAGFEGAMFPWQSGSDGREEAQVLHLNPKSGRWLPDNSQLQRHINVAIAYNVWQYYQATCDAEFMATCGAEMILEIARFWASLASYDRALDRYRILGVMGPDEYHDAYPDSDEPGLDDNAYTNVMAVWVLCRGLEVLDLLPEHRREELWERLSLRREEIERWDEISRKMLVPFHAEGIISQFQGYEDLGEFDWETYLDRYGNIRRLDRILEAEGLTPNRHKASKQADVLMLFYLLSADELGELFERLGYPFDTELIPRNIDYYLTRTSHGSTLSGVVHSWVLARSDRERSWEFFQEALRSDVADVQGGTTPEGIHLGAMAGTVDIVQRCYTGLEMRGDVLWINPVLPAEVGELRLDLRYRGNWLRLEVKDAWLRVTVRAGAGGPVRVGVREEVADLLPGSAAEWELEPGAAPAED